MKKTQTYGEWKSPLTTDKMVLNSNKPADLIAFGSDLYVLEHRPSDSARIAMFKLKDPKIALPPPYSVRTRVHEYGGNAIAKTDSSVSAFYFSNFSDNRIYKLSSDLSPQPLTTETPHRFANFSYFMPLNKLIAVFEDHSVPNAEPSNSIAAIDCNSGEIKILACGFDFFASPLISPDYKKLAFIRWNHPNMPWDSTELVVADIQVKDNEISILNEQVIAGGENISVTQPIWMNNKTLIFISDSSGWYNLYQYDCHKVANLLPMQNDFAPPQWLLGKYSYIVLDDSTIFCTYIQEASWKSAILDINTKELIQLTNDYTSYSSFTLINHELFFISTSRQQAPLVSCFNLSDYTFKDVYSSAAPLLKPAYVSLPESIFFKSNNNQKVHAFFYPPKNPDYEPSNEPIPLIVISHGGPTSMTTPSFDPDIQFWTTRGFAVVDVNYTGSSGFGKKFRDLLKGNWGVIDYQDCENAVDYLIKNKNINPQKVAIRGGSAGGFTTLSALTFGTRFMAGVSYYGVSNLTTLAQTTHKFESRYLDRLITLDNNFEELCFERSPANFPEKISCPILFLQGELDKITPPSQALEIFEALKKAKIPTAYVSYPDEAHGFRIANNVKHSLESELYFYSLVFSFVPHDQISTSVTQKIILNNQNGDQR